MSESENSSDSWGESQPLTKKTGTTKISAADSSRSENASPKQSSPSDRSKELIDWDKDVLEKVVGTKPDAKYGAISESLRHTIPAPTTCSLFCGGRKCKYDTPTYWKKDQMAINGLFSHWVTKNILATARPNLEVNEKYGIIKQFKEHGINSIINLQTPGEHASCGPPLHESGFSYNPQEFMDNDIFFYNFGWPDYGVGSLQNLLDMVKVFQFAVSEGKVAVHCHAGLGRTGVLIVAYLIFANRMDPYEAIHYMRSKRPGSIQTRTQVDFLSEFGHYLIPLRVVFSDSAVKSYAFTLSQFLIRQQHILHGVEARRLKYTPKILAVVCDRLLQLVQLSRPQLELRNSLNLMIQTAPAAFNNTPRSKQNGKLSKTSTSLNPLSGSHHANLRQGKSRSIENIPSSRKYNKKYLNQDSESDDNDDEVNAKYASGSNVRENGHTPHCSTEDVGFAMASTDYSEHVLQCVAEYKQNLNADNATWQQLEAENDPLVLSCLMWDWLDQLKEPVLGSQDVPLMLNHMDEPAVGLTKLGKGARYVVDILLQVVALLSPLSEETELGLIQRMLSTLTQHHLELEATDVTVPAGIGRRTANPGSMPAQTTIRLLQYFYHLLQLKLANVGPA